VCHHSTFGEKAKDLAGRISRVNLVLPGLDLTHYPQTVGFQNKAPRAPYKTFPVKVFGYLLERGPGSYVNDFRRGPFGIKLRGKGKIVIPGPKIKGHPKDQKPYQPFASHVLF
jgi:hypothetical protein